MSYNEDIKAVASQKLPWEKLNGCNILVTGATGLIGSCIIEVLMEHPGMNYHVYASGRDEKRAMMRFAKYAGKPSFHFFHYDVTERLTGDTNFHYIIHAASYASPNYFATKPVEVIKANIEGVANLMDYGLAHDLRRFLYISSGEVYGEGDGSIFTEDYSGYVDCTTLRSCYPASKRAAESLCIAYAHQFGLDVVIARLSHVFGPYFTNNDNRVYAQFIRNVLRGEDIVMKSSGDQFRSWCYIADCVSGILHILLKGDNTNAYNIADNNSNISIKELANIIAEIGNRKVIMEIPSDTEKKGYNIVTKSVFSTEKLESLGWNPSTEGIKCNLKKTIEELKRRISIG